MFWVKKRRHTSQILFWQKKVWLYVKNACFGQKTIFCHWLILCYIGERATVVADQGLKLVSHEPLEWFSCDTQCSPWWKGHSRPLFTKFHYQVSHFRSKHEIKYGKKYGFMSKSLVWSKNDFLSLTWHFSQNCRFWLNSMVHCQNSHFPTHLSRQIPKTDERGK